MKLKTFLTQLQLPFTSVEYYKDSVTSSLKTTALRLGTFLIITAFFSGIQFLRIEFPKIQAFFLQTIAEATAHYPQDLVLTWDQNKLIANTEKIAVSWPGNFQEETPGIPEKFLLYINSEQPPETQGVSTNEYLLFLNRTSIYRSSTENSQVWTAEPLQNFIPFEESVTITKDAVLQLHTDVLSFITQYRIAIASSFFGAYFLIFVLAKLWFFFFETVLAVLLFKLYGSQLQTKQVIKLSLHVMIPTIVVNTLAELMYTNITIPLQTITFWVLIIFLNFHFKTIQSKKG